MDERKRNDPVRSISLLAAIVTTLLILYVLSSGPTRTWALRYRLYRSTATTAAYVDVDEGKWWPTFYEPLVWASGQPWGKLLSWYWNRFPNRVEEVL